MKTLRIGVFYFSRLGIYGLLCIPLDVFYQLARLRRPPAAFLLNKAITRPARGHKTFGQTCPSYMQSFIKIGVLVLEKSADKIMTLCNFNKDLRKIS